MIKRAIAGCGVLLCAIAVGVSLGCGAQGNPASDADTHRVAQEFVAALLGAPTKAEAIRAAKRLGSPAMVDDVDSWYDGFQHDKEHVIATMDGCEVSQTGPDSLPAGNGPCYEFRLQGDPVRDPMNPGYASKAFGSLFVRTTGTSPPHVYDVTYRGGGSECKIGVTCNER
jgi:hypothetical protein